MATSSCVPAFKAALVAALQARSALSAVQVTYAWPGPQTATEGVYLGAVRGELAPASIKTGRQRRDERAELEVICQTWRSASTPLERDDSEARAFVLLAEVDGALADDPAMSATVAWSNVSGYELEVVQFERGWAARLTSTVQFNARLT